MADGKSLTKDDILNRFGYHRGTEETIPKHEQIREAYILIANYLNETLPDGRAKSTAFTWLQQSSMWANFSIAEMSPLVLPDPPAAGTATLF